MESKNVIAAISLSAAVIILYSLFFAPSQEELKQQQIKKEKVEKSYDKSSDTPSLDQNENYTKLTRKDALNENGGVNVELDTVTPPGAMASGSVTFSDGQHKKWTLDQFGRLGLSGGDESYKPSDDDVIEFQIFSKSSSPISSLAELKSLLESILTASLVMEICMQNNFGFL